MSAVPRIDCRQLAIPLALVLIAVAFFRASNAPIAPLDTWGHWKYGEWIWQHQALPEREPFSPYSDQSRPFLDTWWLSQVTCYLVYAKLGMEGIALFYGLVVILKLSLYLVAFRRAAGSLFLAVMGVALMEAGRWTFFGVFRPQTIAEVCWAVLLVAVARPLTLPSPPAAGGEGRVRGAALLGIPVCVCIWANLHGAFLLAFVLLGAMLAGQYLEQVWSRRSLRASLSNPEVKRLGLVLGLSVVSACFNPYGPRLLSEAIGFRKLPVLLHVKEWQPIAPLTTYGSTALVVSLIAVLVTVRLSPLRFRPHEVFLVVFFGFSAWFMARMLPWWWTVVIFVLLPHCALLSWS